MTQTMTMQATHRKCGKTDPADSAIEAEIRAMTEEGERENEAEKARLLLLVEKGGRAKEKALRLLGTFETGESDHVEIMNTATGAESRTARARAHWHLAVDLWNAAPLRAKGPAESALHALASLYLFRSHVANAWEHADPEGDHAQAAKSRAWAGKVLADYTRAMARPSTAAAVDRVLAAHAAGRRPLPNVQCAACKGGGHTKAKCTNAPARPACRARPLDVVAVAVAA